MLAMKNDCVTPGRVCSVTISCALAGAAKSGCQQKAKTSNALRELGGEAGVPGGREREQALLRLGSGSAFTNAASWRRSRRLPRLTALSLS